MDEAAAASRLRAGECRSDAQARKPSVLDRCRSRTGHHQGETRCEESDRAMKPAARLFVSFALLASLALPVRAAEKIKLLYPPLAIFAGAYVAEDQGYSAKHGLEVEFTVAQNSSTIPAALVAEPDTIGGFTPTVLLQANEQGLDLA